MYKTNVESAHKISSFGEICMYKSQGTEVNNYIRLNGT
jgi:hypothetical protein